MNLSHHQKIKDDHDPGNGQVLREVISIQKLKIREIRGISALLLSFAEF